MTVTIYGIRNCDTMKKARAWLDARGITYAFHDYKTAGAPPALVARFADALGWEKLVNRSGLTFRRLPDADKADLDRAEGPRPDDRPPEPDPPPGPRPRRHAVGRLRPRCLGHGPRLIRSPVESSGPPDTGDNRHFADLAETNPRAPACPRQARLRRTSQAGARGLQPDGPAAPPSASALTRSGRRTGATQCVASAGSGRPIPQPSPRWPASRVPP